MRIIKRGALVQFWEQHPDARASLESWYAVVRKANWKTPAELKQVYHSADLLDAEQCSTSLATSIV
jgi:mRNA interferase HigB